MALATPAARVLRIIFLQQQADCCRNELSTVHLHPAWQDTLKRRTDRCRYVERLEIPLDARVVGFSRYTGTLVRTLRQIYDQSIILGGLKNSILESLPSFSAPAVFSPVSRSGSSFSDASRKVSI
jgi:hypothetical protein